MKKAVIRNRAGVITHSTDRPAAEIDAWVAKEVANNSWGLPERDELEPDPIGLMKPTGRRLPAEYTVEVIDLTKDLDWLDSQVDAKRKVEYPSTEQMVQAIWEKVVANDNTLLENFKAQFTAANLKHPKVMRPKDK